MDIKVQSIRAYGKTCIGCKNNERDIMIAFSPEGQGDRIDDLFLTNEQAEGLLCELTDRLDQNKEG